MIIKLLQPAVLLLNNLRYPARFALIGLLTVSVVLWLAWVLVGHQQERLQGSRHELAALEILKPLARQIQLVQQHRGLSAGVLGGNTGMQASLQNKQAEVDTTAATVTKVLQQHAKVIPLEKEWQPLQQAWEQLKTQGPHMTVAESFASHSQLLERLLALQMDVADAGAMIGDPDLDTVYLIDTLVQRLPQLLERLGQLRARGTALLTQKVIDEPTRVEIAVHLALLEQVQSVANTNLHKTIKAAPQLADALTASSQELNTAINVLTQIVRNDVLAEQFATPPAEYFKQATDTIDIGYRLSFENMTPALEQQINTRIRTLERQMWQEIGLASGMTLVMIYLFCGFYYVTVSAVVRLSRTARAMSQGDLTCEVKLASRDELSQVADAINSMREGMTQLLRQILNSAHQVAQAAGSLVTSSSDVSNSSQEQSDAAMSMAATVEELTVSIDQIAEHARSAEQSSRHSGELLGQSATVVAGAADEMQNIANTVHRSSSIIQTLGQDTERISTIVGVIKEIADQTNLLALNAAIEAARAGEQGRGFAVVADEVRKLAERTAQSTQEISVMIATIQSGTEQAVASMQDGVARVEQGVAMSRDAGESITQVRSGADKVVQLVEEIALSLHQQSEASNDIARNVESIAQMSQENTAAVHAVAATAKQMEQLSFELDKLAQKFRLP